jgi:hypothetical protein
MIQTDPTEGVAETQDPTEDNLDNLADAIEGQPEGEETGSFTNIDPASLPEDVQPLYKSMQADYTRSKQAMKDAPSADEVTALRQQAEYFNKIMNDPSFRKQVFAAADAGNPQGSAPAQGGPVSYYGADISELEDDSIRQVKEIAMQAINEQVLPGFQAALGDFQDLRKEMALQDWKAISSRYDGADAHLTAVSDFLTANPNFLRGQPTQVRLEKALSVVSDVQPKASARQGRNATAADKRKAQVQRPGVPSGNARPAGKKSLAEMLREAQKDLGIT